MPISQDWTQVEIKNHNKNHTPDVIEVTPPEAITYVDLAINTKKRSNLSRGYYKHSRKPTTALKFGYIRRNQPKNLT